MNEQLIFVYNANSGLFSTVTDFAHKLLSPSTYQCHLCALTYGNITIKQAWKSFISSLALKAVFLHKDEFEERYSIQTDLPAAYILTGSAVQQLITRQEIDNCRSLEALKSMVTEKIARYVQHHHTHVQ